MNDPIDEVPIATVSGGTGDFKKSDVIPAGIYLAKITAIDKVEGLEFKTNVPQTQLEFEFTIAEGEHEGKKLYRSIAPKLTAGGDKKSNLTKIATAALGKEPTPVEFHVSSLKGRELRVYVTTQQGKTGSYARIEDYLVKE